MITLIHMKKSLRYMVLSFLILSITSCSDDSDMPEPSSSSTTNLIEGSWRVTSFIDEGVDKTNELDGYLFSFRNNGEVLARNNSTARTVLGTWSTLNDDGKSEFILDFGKLNGEVFHELSEDWIKMKQTSSRISLRYDNPVNNYELIFERN